MHNASFWSRYFQSTFKSHLERTLQVVEQRLLLLVHRRLDTAMLDFAEERQGTSRVVTYLYWLRL
jgi:hypothetical protein